MSTTGVGGREKHRGFEEEPNRSICRGPGGGVRGGNHRFRWLARVSMMVKVADPDLHNALRPFKDPALLERHGKQVLDIIIRLASETRRKRELDRWVENGASTGATDALLWLFASYGDSVDDRTLSWLLDAAAKGGSVELLSALLSAGAGPLVRSADGVSPEAPPLHVAAQKGHRRCVAKLIEAGAPVDSMHAFGGTALTAAAKGCHKGAAVELIAAGADVNKTLDISCRNWAAYVAYADFTPLCNAVNKNDEGMVKLLLEAGADPSKGPADFLPLHMAACLASYEITNILLLAGARVSSVNKYGHSALDLACAYNQPAAVDLLLRHNASAAYLGKSRNSPMDYVGAQVLALRQQGAIPIGTRRGITLVGGGMQVPALWARDRPRQDCRPTMARPCTLNSAETCAADKICDLLQSAGAWSRRGWLVVMRSRSHVEVAKELDHSTEDAFTLPVLAVPLVHEPSKSAAGCCVESGINQAFHDGGQARPDWSAAVVRLLRVPGENLFRKIVRFL